MKGSMYLDLYETDMYNLSQIQEIFGQKEALNSTRLGIFLKLEKRQEILGNVAQKMVTWDIGCGTGLIKFVNLTVMSEGEKNWGASSNRWG